MAHRIPAAIAISILRRPDVDARTGLSRSALYTKMAANTFPRSVRLGVCAVGWIESEIDDRLAAQVPRSRPTTIPNKE